MPKKRMSQVEAAQRIRMLKPGKQCTAESNEDRIVFLKVAKLLRDTGMIDFQIISKANDNGGFTIYAV